MEELLQIVEKIVPLSRQGKEVFLQICKPITVSKQALVQDIGHTCKTIYFVKKGILRIFYFKEATDITESFEFENAFVARAESLFSGKPSRKAIQALEDCELIAIDAIALFQQFDIHPELERVFRKLVEQAYVTMVQRIENIQFHTAEERYKQLLHTQPELLKRVPLKYIASYLGITQVSLSRIRAAK